MTNQELILGVMRAQGKADALDLRARAPELDGTALIDEENKIPVFDGSKDYTSWKVGSPVRELVDGEWQVFTRVCMPQCRAALYSIAILVFIDYWNMVEQPIVLLPDAEKQPLSVYLSTINTGEVGLAFAIATIYMVPTLLLFLHGEEYLVEGIATQGSVKG